MLTRRLLQGILLLFAASALSFLLAALTPGEYFDELRLDPNVPEDTIESMRQRYGVGDPLAQRYLRWLGSVTRGELGFSLRYRTEVRPLLLRRAGNTLLLTGLATSCAWALALPFGIWAATSPKKWASSFFSGSTSLLLAIPDLVLALLALMLAIRSGWFPVGGMRSSNFDSLGPIARASRPGASSLLPALVIALGLLPTLSRHVRAAVGETLDAPFVRAARARGLPERTILYRHVLPAAANPLISLAGLSIASLAGISLVVEVVLAWPGIGPLLLESIQVHDIDLVIGGVLITTLLLVIGNGLADLALWMTDPRLRRRDPSP